MHRKGWRFTKVVFPGIYSFDFVGYSYFRKASEYAEDNEEIFCDEESKFGMMKRVYKGRIIPLIVIFFAVIVCKGRNAKGNIDFEIR